MSTYECGEKGGRDSAVNHMRQTHHDPDGILARASTLAGFATAWARWKFNVVWQRLLDAAAHGTIQAMDMVNVTGFMHGSPPGRQGYLCFATCGCMIFSYAPRGRISF